MSILKEHIDVETMEMAGFEPVNHKGSVHWYESWTRTIIGYTFDVNIYEDSFFVHMMWRDVTSHTKIERVPGPASLEMVREIILLMTDGCIDIMKQY